MNVAICPFIVIVMAFYSAVSMAQDGFFQQLYPKVTIETLSDEQFSGRMKPRKYVEGYISEFVLLRKEDEKLYYKAEDVRWVRMHLSRAVNNLAETDNEDILFEPHLSPRKKRPVLLMCIVEGPIKVYYDDNSDLVEQVDQQFEGLKWDYSHEEGFSIDLSYVYFTREWHSSFLVAKNGGELVKVNKKHFKEVWESMFCDCDEFMNAVDQKKNAFENFLSLAEEYNRLCGDDRFDFGADDKQ